MTADEHRRQVCELRRRREARQRRIERKRRERSRAYNDRTNKEWN